MTTDGRKCGHYFWSGLFSLLVASQWLFIFRITVVRLCLNSIIGFIHYWPFFPFSSSSVLFSIPPLPVCILSFCVCFLIFFALTNMLKSGSSPLLAVTFSDWGSATKPPQSVLVWGGAWSQCCVFIISTTAVRGRDRPREEVEVGEKLTKKQQNSKICSQFATKKLECFNKISRFPFSSL